MLVRYLARKFQREGEARGRAPTPAVERGVGRDGVEGRVNFDRVEGARVEVEHAVCARAARVEDGALRERGRHPIVVVPTLTADAHARPRGRDFVNFAHLVLTLAERLTTETQRHRVKNFKFEISNL